MVLPFAGKMGLEMRGGCWSRVVVQGDNYVKALTAKNSRRTPFVVVRGAMLSELSTQYRSK